MFDPLRAKTRVLLYAGLAFLFGVGLASGMGWTAGMHAMPALLEEPQVSEAEVKPALDLSDAFVRIAEEVTPAVVRIQTERRARTASRSPLEDFFFDRRRGTDPETPTPPQISGGSGFFISQDGYVLTNNHVVDGAESITVFLSDGQQYPAELVGTDPTTDVAVIRVDGSGFPRLSFGTSDGLRVGEWVLAVGNPGFGGGTQLDYTVTAGIVSAIGRPLNLINRELQRDPAFSEGNASWAIEDFIQTDAVINPGNSGGPMVNLRGQVVGINSAIASQTGYYQGYGFAIPIDLARRVSEDLIEYGQIRRPWLGISMRSLDALDAESAGLDRVFGAMVQDVTPGGPAEAAGLRQGDVIVRLGGEEVARSARLQQLIALRRPGDEVAIEIVRNGDPRTFQVRLGEAPINDRTAVASAPVESEAHTVDRLGINLRELTPDLADAAGFDQRARGVVVFDVQPFGPASRRGMARFDRIAELNGAEIASVEDVRRELDRLQPGQIARFVVDRADGSSRIINIRIPS